MNNEQTGHKKPSVTLDDFYLSKRIIRLLFLLCFSVLMVFIHVLSPALFSKNDEPPRSKTVPEFKTTGDHPLDIWVKDNAKG